MVGELLPGTVRKDVIVDGVRFALRRSDPPGEPAGPPVLLLHGVPETSAMWRDLLPELAGDRVVLAPDLKGLGDSEARGPYDTRTLVRELVALVRSEVSGPVDVVGHDWGGSLAVMMATGEPDFAHRLVVLNAPFREVDYSRAWHMLLFSAPALPEALFSLGRREAVSVMLRSGWRSRHPLDAEIAEHYRAAYAAPDRMAAMLAYYRGATRPRLRRRAERFLANRANEVPPGDLPALPEHALVVWGALDPVLPVRVGEAVVRDLGARTEMVTVPDAGHFVLEEAPGVVVPAVASFLHRATPGEANEN